MGAITVNGSCDPCLFNFGYLYTYVLDWLIKHNVQIPTYPPGGCVEILRANSVSCWHFRYDGATHDYVYDWCETTGCCWNKFKVCNTGSEVTVTYIEGSNPYIFCEEENGHVCTYVCDLVYNYYNPPLPKIGQPEQIETDDINSASIELKPNPSKGDISLDGHNFDTDNIILKVSDIIGSIIFEESIKIQSGHFQINLSNRFKNDGAYFLRFFYNKNKMITKSVVISK